MHRIRPARFVRATTVVCLATVAMQVGSSPASAAVAGSARWTQLAPASSPGARYYSAMTYDGLGHLVLFGGYNDATGFLGDTWTFNGSTWTQETPAHHPSARDGASMLYDSVSQSVILFGGEDGTGFADTWSWNGNSHDWTQLTPATSPPRRAWAGMATSPTTSQVILFGGLDSAERNDTWSWNGSNWAQLTPAHSPPARSDFTMSSDTVHHQIVVFGGGVWPGLTKANLSTQFGDTWTFDGNDWTQAATTGPHARINAHAAFDPRFGRVLLFGGFDNGSQAYYQDTWTWTGAAWASVPTAAAATKRDTGVMAYLPSAGRVVLFGGFAPPTANLADTWALSLATVTSAPLLSTMTSSTKSLTVSWGAPGSPLSYTLQYAQRTKNSSGTWITGAWQAWKTVGPTIHSSSFTGTPGTTYLFRARANYPDGSTSGFSAAATTIVPYDDRAAAITHSTGWAHHSVSGRFLGTVTDTSLAGKTMTLKTAAHAFYLIGDKCAGCGKFRVYIDGALVKTVDAHAASTRSRQVLYTKTFTGTKTHTIKIKTLGTAGRPKVRIDAIGVQR